MREKQGCFYAFGPFLVDTAQRAVFRDGVPVPLTPKTYDTLLLLIENRGRVLPKSDMMKSLWPDSFVEEANLTQQISTIRKALGEAASTDPYITTVPGRGYRFAAEVTEREAEAVPAPTVPLSAPETELATQKAQTTKRSRRIAAAALALLCGSLLARSCWNDWKRASPGQAANQPRSLAILPFQSLTKDANSEFLGFSLVDAIITRLGYVNSLTVRPSYAVAKYRSQLIDLQKVAAELHVDTLLTGSFLRDAGDLRITSQLIDVRTQKILWKSAFDVKYDKLLTVQDSVARQIVKELELNLSPQEGERFRSAKTIDAMAYEYYLRGVDLYAKNDFNMATRMLERSAEIDPGYALTWAHLGRSYTAMASFQFGGREQYSKAQAYYEKALSLEPALIEAQIYMANFFTDTGRAERAVPLLRQAIRTNPNLAEAHWELGYAYRFGGMLNESAAECTRARQLDPSVKLTSSALNAWLYLGNYDRFLETLPRTADTAFILFYRGLGEYYKKQFSAAANDFDRGVTLDPSIFQSKLGQAFRSAIKGRTAEGLKTLKDAESRIEQQGVGDPEGLYKIAQGYAVLGDKPSALRLLRRSIEGGFYPYPYLNADPLMEPVKHEAEFVTLMNLARQRHLTFQSSLF